MKKKVIIITAVIVLVLGIGGTGVGLAWKNSNQKSKQTEQTAEFEENTKTADNKKSEKKEKDKTDFNMCETDVTEINTAGKAVENPVLNNGTSENATDSSISSPVKNNLSESQNNNSNSTPAGNTSSGGNGNNSKNDVNSGSGNNTNNSTPTQSTQPTHTHTWIHIDATGHYETVTIQAAWDETIPVYENIEHEICNQCGADITNNVNQHFDDSIEEYLNGKSDTWCGGWHSEWKYEQTGIQTVHHEAVTEQRYIQDSPEYHVCSECGATTDCNCTR